MKRIMCHVLSHNRAQRVSVAKDAKCIGVFVIPGSTVLQAHYISEEGVEQTDRRVIFAVRTGEQIPGGLDISNLVDTIIAPFQGYITSYFEVREVDMETPKEYV